MLDGVREEIAQALTLAELAPEPDPTTAFTDVLADYTVPNPFERAATTLDSASRQSGEGIHATGTRG